MTFSSKKNFFLFIPIVLVSLLTFFPSFSHCFRSDQIVYLANTRHYDDIFSLSKNLWAYEHVREYLPGDTIFFRPLTSLTLGLEKAFFGSDFIAWHILGFIGHLLVIWILLNLLYRVNANPLAFGFALLFSSLYAGVDAVIWEHISSYLIFSALILGSIYFLKEACLRPEKGRPLFFMAYVLLLFACFFHELAVLFTWPLLNYYIRENTKNSGRIPREGFLLLLIPGLYVSAYILVNFSYQNASLNILARDQIHAIFNFENAFNAIRIIPRFFMQNVIAGFFPTALKGQLGLSERLAMTYKPFPELLVPLFFINCFTASVFLMALIKGISIQRIKENKNFIILMAHLIGIVIIIIPLARITTHGAQYVLNYSSYYSYMFWVYFLLLLHAITDWSCLKNIWKTKGALASLIALVIIFLLNSHQTLELNQGIKLNQAPLRHYLLALNHFVSTHQKEEDFRFRILNDVKISLSKLDPQTKLPQQDDLDLAEILYHRYHDKSRPKYILTQRAVP